MTLGFPEWSWKIDGRAVPLGDWRASADLFGFARASGTIPEEHARRVRQGSRLVGYVANREGWRGRLSRSPFPFRGLARIDAAGHQEQVNKYRRRHLYLSRDITEWFLRSGPPVHSIESSEVDVSIDSDRVMWKENAGAPAFNPQFASVCFWAKGSPGGITRLALTHRATSGAVGSRFYEVYSTPNFPADTGYVQVPPGVGETSGATNRDWSTALGMANLGKSGILLQRKYVGGASTYAEGFAMAYNLRVGGIATTDTFLTSQVVADYAARLGIDAGLVRTGFRNAMPLDVIDDSPLDVFATMALLEEWHPPRIVAADGVSVLDFAPWDHRVWTVYVGRDVVPDLARMEDFNEVRVVFDLVGGVSSEAVRHVDDLGLPNPLEGIVDDAGQPLVNTLDLSLPDPQANDQLAREVADANLPWASSRKFTGRLAAAGVKGGDPYVVLPGDTVRVADFGPLDAALLRVHAAAWTKDTVEWGIEAPSTSGLLARALLAPSAAAPVLPTPEPRFSRDEWRKEPKPPKPKKKKTGSYEKGGSGKKKKKKKGGGVVPIGGGLGKKKRRRR